MPPPSDHHAIPGNPSTAKSSVTRLNDRGGGGRPLRSLSEADWQHWVEEGYVIVPAAISPERARQTAALLWEFEAKDPADPATWYTPPRAEMRMTELINSGMVEVYNHPLLWANRQEPRVYEAFVDLWGTEHLWVTIDRANLNFPDRPGYDFPGFIHWDYDPETRPVNVQGVLALNDQTDPAMGGFQCVPELYRTYDQWKLTQPDDRDRFQPDVSGFPIEKVKLRTGDLLIFNSLLPHGIRPNRSENKVRMAQYISMMPAQPDDVALRDWRIRSWRDRIAPEGYAFPGDPRGWERTRYPRATLSPLGEKLLGLVDWA